MANISGNNGNSKRLYLGGSKITADCDCSHEKTPAPWKESYDSILNSRDITLPTKVRLVKDMVYPVVMHGCESWTIKKAECRRMDAFELWWWRRLCRGPWTARRSSWSIPKETSLNIHWRTNVEAETAILWPPDAKNQLIGKDPAAGNNWRWEEKGTTRWLDGITGFMDQREFE